MKTSMKVERSKKKESHKVIRVENDVYQPRCPHGQMLLFEKTCGSETSRFFACAAFRSRDECQFYLNEDEKNMSQTITEFADRSKKFVTNSYMPKYEKLQQNIQAATKFYFCHSCCSSVEIKEVPSHKGHKIFNIQDKTVFERPTKFLLPLKDTTKEAQFFFTEESKKYLISTLSKLNVASVISIGTPSLVEDLPSKIKFYLLDFDWRFGVFYGDSFSWYNMFNHHFMETVDDPTGSASKSQFDTFLKSCSKDEAVAILLDPPFGGRVEPIADTVKRVAAEVRQAGCAGEIFFFWIFPYFMEPYLTAELQTVSMLDYRVNYCDHKMYNQDSRRGRTLGSPIRIFTNAPTSQLPQPAEGGYYFCKKCQMHRHNENVHCNLCKTCPSKAGGTYKHCGRCKRCVKPRWVHCDTCKKCATADHKCLQIPVNRKAVKQSKTPAKRLER